MPSRRRPPAPGHGLWLVRITFAASVTDRAFAADDAPDAIQQALERFESDGANTSLINSVHAWRAD